MDNNANDYHFSFFKPSTPQARTNRNMVIQFLVIWAVAIFGFQILLRVMEEPTPEPAHTAYSQVWENVQTGEASPQEMQIFAQSTLSVICKIMIAEDAKPVLRNCFSYAISQLTPDSLRAELSAKIATFEVLVADDSTDVSDANYMAQKASLSANLGPVLGLIDLDVRSKILPLEVKSAQMAQLSPETIEALPSIMDKYLIHNRSVLTDTKFLGFPFHYFYNAIFLLVLFVGICWLYCFRIDQINAKYNIED